MKLAVNNVWLCLFDGSKNAYLPRMNEKKNLQEFTENTLCSEILLVAWVPHTVTVDGTKCMQDTCRSIFPVSHGNAEICVWANICILPTHVMWYGVSVCRCFYLCIREEIVKCKTTATYHHRWTHRSFLYCKLVYFRLFTSAVSRKLRSHISREREWREVNIQRRCTFSDIAIHQ